MCFLSLRVNLRPKVPRPIQRRCQLHPLRRCQRRHQRRCQLHPLRRRQRHCQLHPLRPLQRRRQRRRQLHPLRRLQRHCQLYPLHRCQRHPLRLCQPLSVVQRVLTGHPETFQHSIVLATSNARGGN